MDSNDFDVDAFLERPLTARLASVGPHGPAVRAIWYLWEHGSFWWLTGPWSALAAQLDKDPRVALIVDVCDLAGGDVKQVLARGRAALHPYNANRARRKRGGRHRRSQPSGVELDHASQGVLGVTRGIGAEAETGGCRGIPPVRNSGAHRRVATAHRRVAPTRRHAT
jgi:hypothetical protein